MGKENKRVTFMDITGDMQRHHSFVLTHLYRAQAGDETTGATEDYWRGALNGIEACLDALGIEHTEFSPLGYLQFDKRD